MGPTRDRSACRDRVVAGRGGDGVSDDTPPTDEPTENGDRKRDDAERTADREARQSTGTVPADGDGADDLPVSRRGLLVAGTVLLGGSGITALAVLGGGPADGPGEPGGGTGTATPTDSFGYGGTATATATAVATATVSSSGGTTDASTSSGTETATATGTPNQTPTATATPTPTPTPEEEYGEQLYGEYSYGGDSP